MPHLYLHLFKTIPKYQPFVVNLLTFFVVNHFIVMSIFQMHLGISILITVVMSCKLNSSYIQGHNYSHQVLPLPSGHYLCSNLINFYTHIVPSRCYGNPSEGEKPEREIPHFQNPITVEFVLRPAAMAKYNDLEHEFKVFASFDDGVSGVEVIF